MCNNLPRWAWLYAGVKPISFDIGRYFAEDIFKCIFMNEKFCILIQISLQFVPKGLIDNKTAVVQIMAWRRTVDKPLPETMLIQFICVTRGRWVNVYLNIHVTLVCLSNWYILSFTGQSSWFLGDDSNCYIQIEIKFGIGILKFDSWTWWH